MDFKWIDWNLEKLAKHGVRSQEAESVVEQDSRPQKVGDDKWLAIGRGSGGRLIRVVFVIEPDDRIFVIHAKPLIQTEKKRWRRRQGRR